MEQSQGRVCVDFNVSVDLLGGCLEHRVEGGDVARVCDKGVNVGDVVGGVGEFQVEGGKVGGAERVQFEDVEGAGGGSGEIGEFAACIVGGVADAGDYGGMRPEKESCEEAKTKTWANKRASKRNVSGWSWK